MFLDFDGVVSFYDPKRPALPALQRLVRERVQRLNRILATTKAEVVISSNWRTSLDGCDGYGAKTLEGWLMAAGFVGRIIGITPRLASDERGNEIQAWIDAQGTPPDVFCILEDFMEMQHLEPHVVRTREEVGLTDQDVEKAIRLLRRRPQKSRTIRPAA